MGLGSIIKGATKAITSPQGLGTIIGAALAAPTGGMSIAWGASLGGMAGSAIGGGKPMDIAGAGALGYGLGSLATPMLAPRAAPALGGGANPMGSGFGGTARPAAGGVGSLGAGTNAGQFDLSLASGHTPAMHSGSMGGYYDVVNGSQLPSLEMNVDPYTLTGSQPSVLNSNYLNAAANQTAATEAPFWESDMMKYGSGIALLAGLMEDPNYETVKSPKERPSQVDQYYADVAEFGEGNVPVPAALQAPPPSRVNNYGSKRLGAKRYAQGGAVDSEPAWLTPGEFVMTKDAVRGAGGAKQMYELMDKLEQRGAR